MDRLYYDKRGRYRPKPYLRPAMQAPGGNPVSEPRTEAGRALLEAFHVWSSRRELHEEMRDAILAIEREAAASQPLDVDRLARAMLNVGRHAWAPELAAEYARLSRKEPSDE